MIEKAAPAISEEVVTDLLVNGIRQCPVPGATFAWLYEFACAVAAQVAKQEREDCAKVCEKRAIDTVPDDSALDQLYYAAADIRARAAAAMAG